MRLFDHGARGNEAILMLDQQPLLGVLGAHEGERALQLLATQLDAELARRDAVANAAFGLGAIVEREAALVGTVDAAIPHDDFARAVLAGRYHALERAVVVRMVFDEDRETLLARVERRPLGHGPG